MKEEGIDSGRNARRILPTGARHVDPTTGALVVFDMVNDFLEPESRGYMPGAQDLVGRLAPFIESCRNSGLLVVYVLPRGYDAAGTDLGQLAAIYPDRATRPILVRGTLGIEPHRDLAPRDGDLQVMKVGYSAFSGTGLEEQLRARGVDTLVISGVATNIGCDTFAREAFLRGFDVVFLSDGTWTRPLVATDGSPLAREEIERVVLATMAFAFGRVASMADVVSELAAAREPRAEAGR